MLDTAGVAVIVGGSIAGVTAADELRMVGHDGPIVLADEQRHRPYARPPLSKAVLTGKDTIDSAFLPPLDDLDVECRTDVSAAEVLPDESVLVLSNGERLRYDGLVIATAASPITLADLGLNDTGLPELVLRTLDDAVLLRERLGTAESIVVVGGGILGMELASAAREAGLRTTVLTNEPPLLTMGCEFLSALVSERAERAGVAVHHHPGGVELVERGGRLAASLAGRVFEADVVVTTIGDRPRIDWLLSSRLADARGVQVDDRCRVSEGVVAAGDVIMRSDGRGVWSSPDTTACCTSSSGSPSCRLPASSRCCARSAGTPSRRSGVRRRWRRCGRRGSRGLRQGSGWRMRGCTMTVPSSSAGCTTGRVSPSTS